MEVGSEEEIGQKGGGAHLKGSWGDALIGVIF